MKRVITLLIAASLLMLSFSGCNKAKLADSSGGGNKFVTLKMFYPTGTGNEADMQLVKDEINKYLKAELNCEVEIESPDYATFYQKLPLKLQSGEKMDYIFANTLIFFNNLPKKAFLPLDELLNHYGKGIKETIPSDLLESMKVKGVTYVLPTYKDIGESEGLYYRKDLVSKHNLDIKNADTLAEFDTILSTLKEKEPNMVPYWMNNQTVQIFKLDVQPEDEFRYEAIHGLKEFYFDTKTEKVLHSSKMPERISLYKYFEKWNKAGYINSDAATTNTVQYAAAQNNKTGIVVQGGKPETEKNLSLDLGTEYVRGYTTTPKLNVSAARASMCAIPFSSQNPERAMMLINKLYTDKKLINLFVNGVEGKNYVKVDENTIKLPEGVTKASDKGYNPGIEWRMGNQFLNYLWENESKDKWEKFKTFNANAKEVKLSNFMFNQEPVKTQIAAINNIYSEFETPLRVGALDVDKAIPQYISKLEANGLNEIIAEMEKQYKEWKAN
ncbi:MAG: hypothetical protein BGN88_01060 [Clostridiales bacterium 43-6]|nr:MAG: hypothetical protein BGN88_01060 [Clostridiales bacterium 43-6]